MLQAGGAGGGRVIARSPTFTPKTTRSPDFDFAAPGGTVEAQVDVKNASKAPRGTAFEWDWGSLDADKLEAGAKPPPGPKAKKVGDAEAQPALDYGVSGDRAFDFLTPVQVGIQAPDVKWDKITAFGVLATGAARAAPGDGEQMNDVDTLTVFANVGGIAGDAQAAGTTLGMKKVDEKSGAGINLGVGRWVKPNEAAWDIVARAPGKSRVRVEAGVPGMAAPIAHEFDLTAVADPEFFKGRCSTAETRLNELHAAGREWFMKTSENYQDGFKRHQAALDAQKALDKLVEDLMWGILFAGVGGAAGGFIGSTMKNAAVLKDALGAGSRSLETLTDTTKDLAKYLVRLPANSALRSRAAKFAGSESAGGGGGGGQHEGADPSSAGVAAGEGKPAGVDPLKWMTRIDGKIAGERRDSGAVLGVFQEWADEALAYPQGDNPFDFDPVEEVERSSKLNGKPLTELGPIPSSDEYEQAFWITWIQTYAYKVVTTASKAGSHSSVDENIGKELREAIDRVAKKFGKTGDQWIEEYGGASKAAAEASAKASNRHGF
jgi:hypothetical protein